MEKNRFLSKFILGIAASCIALTGSSSTLNNDKTAANTLSKSKKYGIVANDVKNYFESSIKGTEATYKKSKKLKADQVDEASQYVWELWKNTLQNNLSEKLPALDSHSSINYWGHINEPDGTWQLPDGGMKFFYGSKGDKPETGYPLFIFLHGSGADTKQEWNACLSWAQAFKEGSSIYFLPESPHGGTKCRWYQPSRQAKWEQLIKQALIDDKIDPLKIYFMGISEGAYGSQRLASFYADYLAGAGPIAGGEQLLSCPPENLANIAYCMQTGEHDTAYGRKLLTLRADSLLKNLQATHKGYYTHKIDLQPEKGHGCDYTVTNPWLVKYSRNINPRYVYWENCGLGGINGEPIRYRDAFYNLYIVESSDDRTNDFYRTVYEMNIEDNTIDITVKNVTIKSTEPATGRGWKMDIGVDKTYTQATTGKIRIYLNNSLVDLSKPVTVKVNGVKKFKGKVSPDTRNLVESCAIFYDPMRLFPAAVEVSVN